MAAWGREEGILSFEFDKNLIEKVADTGVPGMRIYGFDRRAVVAGRGSRLSREVHLNRIRRDKVPIYRRRGGGCAVFLDPGNLIVSIAFPAEGFGNVGPLFCEAGNRVIRALARAGITGVYRDGISDLVIENRKIAGACFHRSKDMAYYSAALLVSPDLGAMDAYLSHPPREPDYRRGRPHKAFVAGLDSFFPELTVSRLESMLTTGLDLSGIEAGQGAGIFKN
jgi:lipoate-protein ligase A